MRLHKEDDFHIYYAVDSIKYGTKIFIIDKLHQKEVEKYNWWVKPGHDTFYIHTTITINKKRTTLTLHRLITNKQYEIVDHIDGNGLNNSISNLRGCTRTQNLQNQKRNPLNKKSKLPRGVYNHYKKFTSRIVINKKIIQVGRFDTPEEAKEAYDKKAKELFGEFYNNT